MAATKSAGRVSIRVLPDSTRFKRDLETSLRRIERQLMAKIEAELYISRESLAKLKRQIESLVVKIKPTIELNVTPEDIAALKAKIESMKPKVAVELNTVEASRRIATLSRTRTLNLIPVIMGSRTVTNFVAKMRGLAGLNILGDSFREGITFFQNIDRNAVKIGTLLTKMSALAAMAGTTAANLIVMTSQLASIGNLALLAPAFISGFAIGVSVLVVALKDMKTVLKDLGPQFTRLQDSISKSFWNEAEAPIRSLVKTLMPTLNTQLKETGKRMGSLFGEVAASVERNATPAILERMFDRMHRAITISKDAINPLTRAFVTLGDHGSKYFERFSKWIVKISDQFDAFITKSAANGNLDRWTENAIQGMKDLGNVMRGTVRVFAALNKAAVASGAANLGDFGDALNRAADIMNKPRFQATMTTLFAGMNAAVEGILRGVGKLGPAIETAAPTIFRVFSTIGDIGSRVGGMLATIISNPEFLAGFERLITGISSALYRLEPAMKPFADSLGGAMTLMGEILKAVADVANAFAVKLMPELDKIGLEFGKLVGPFRDSMLRLIDEIKPLITTLNDEVVKPLVALIKDEVLPLFDKLVKFASPSVKLVLEELGTFIKDDLTPLFQRLNGEMDKANANEGPTKFRDVLKEIMDFLPKLANPKELMPGFNGNWFGGLFTGQADNFMKDWENFKRPINEWWNNTVWPGFEGMILDGLKGFESWIETDFGPWGRKAMADLWDGIISMFGFGSKGEENLKKQGEEWDKFWDGVGQAIEDGYNNFKRDVQAWLATINPIEEILDSLFGGDAKDPSGTGGMGGGAGGRGMSPGAKISPRIFDEEAEKTWLSTLFTNLNTTMTGFGPGLLVAIEAWKPGVTQSWNTFWEGLKTSPGGTLPTVAAGTAVTMTSMGISIGTFIAENAPKWGTFFANAQTQANERTAGAAVSVGANVATMGASLAGFIAEHAPTWKTAWETMQTNVTSTMGNNELTTGQKVAGMGMSIAGFLSQTRATWGPLWETVKSVVSNAWTTVTGDTRTGVGNAASEAGQLPQKAKTAMGDTRITLLSSGAALVAGFAQGMNNNVSLVQRAAIGVAAMVAKYMPHSPAEMGPLSGKGYTTWSGRALVKDFAGGMMDNMDQVRAATAKVANAAQLGSSFDLNNDLGENGITIDRREVNLKVYYPVAEPTSRTLEKSANTLRMAGAL